MWTPNQMWHSSVYMPKRIKSAAHLIVNCNIKPNWIPITFDHTRHSVALFFCRSGRVAAFLIESARNVFYTFSLAWISNRIWILCENIELHDSFKCVTSPNSAPSTCWCRCNTKLCRIRNKNRRGRVIFATKTQNCCANDANYVTRFTRHWFEGWIWTANTQA